MRNTRNAITLAILLSMGIGLVGCEDPVRDYAEANDSGKMRACFWRILDGQGEEPLGPNGEDSFTLLQEMLSHSDRNTRAYVTGQLDLSTVGTGGVYKYAIDGYIDAGRDKELQAALYEAWQREKEVAIPIIDDVRTHTNMAQAYLHLRRRQHLHSHPELAKVRSADRKLPLPWGEHPSSWGGFNRGDHEFLDDRLIESGDKEYLEVLAYYREYYSREKSP